MQRAAHLARFAFGIKAASLIDSVGECGDHRIQPWSAVINLGDALEVSRDDFLGTGFTCGLSLGECGSIRVRIRRGGLQGSSAQENRAGE